MVRAAHPANIRLPKLTGSNLRTSAAHSPFRTAPSYTSLGLMAYGHWPRSSGEWAGFVRTLGPFALSMVGAVIGALVLARYLPHIPYINRLMLRPAVETEEGLTEPTNVFGPDVSALLGAIGVAATPLRPAGKAKIGDEFVDVVAEGSYVEVGARVQVIEIEGYRIVVKEVL